MKAPRLDPLRSLVLAAAVALAGCGGKGGGSKVVTNPDPNTTEGLSGFTAAAGDGEVVLRWRTPSTSSFSQAVVRRKVGGAPTSTTDGDPVYAGTDSTFTDTNVVNGTTYVYAGFAVHLLEASGASTANARPLPPAPAPPAGFSASAQTHGASLTWQNPSGATIVVRMSVGNYPTWTTGTRIYQGTGTSVAPTDLGPAHVYYFRAWTVDPFDQYSLAPTQATATPLYEYLELSIPAWSVSRLCPTHPTSGAGDREFAGHGPRIIVHLSYGFPPGSSTLYAYLSFRAQEEPAGDGTYATGSWSYSKVTIPAGWRFDSWTGTGAYADNTVDFLDTDHGIDHRGPFGSGPAIGDLYVVGDTDGDDVGNCTTDDTQLWSLSANARTFRVRR